MSTPATPSELSIAPFAVIAQTQGEEDDEDREPRWELILADFHSPIEVFEEIGHTGSGYAWDSVARVAMKGLPEAQVAGFSFDSEAGTFVVTSSDQQAIRALGAKLFELLQDHDALRAAIAAVPEDDWDD